MNKTRMVGRIIAGAVASALLLGGTLAAPAEARDTGWNEVKGGVKIQPMDTGWNEVK